MEDLQESLKRLLAVGCGGFVGAVARYSISAYIKRRFPMSFPLGTLTVNALGCLLIGFLMAWFSFGWDTPKDGLPVTRPAWLTVRSQLFLVHGLLGSLTTFSTFGYETLELMRELRYPLAIGNIATSLVVGILFVWLGHHTARVWLS